MWNYSFDYIPEAVHLRSIIFGFSKTSKYNSPLALATVAMEKEPIRGVKQNTLLLQLGTKHPIISVQFIKKLTQNQKVKQFEQLNVLQSFYRL